MFEDERVGLVITLEEFQVQLDGLLAGEDFAQSIVDLFRVLQREYKYSVDMWL